MALTVTMKTVHRIADEASTVTLTIGKDYPSDKHIVRLDMSNSTITLQEDKAKLITKHLSDYFNGGNLKQAAERMLEMYNQNEVKCSNPDSVICSCDICFLKKVIKE